MPADGSSAKSYKWSQSIDDSKYRTGEMLDILDGEWYDRLADAPSYASVAASFGVGDGCDSVGGTLPHTVEFNGEQTPFPPAAAPRSS